jgi:hypothetical protein
LATGLALFRATYNLLKAMAYPIQFQFHLSDFVDYGHPGFSDLVPERSGVYVPQAVTTPLNTKLILFQKALDIIANDYSFITLEAWAMKRAGPP